MKVLGASLRCLRVLTLSRHFCLAASPSKPSSPSFSQMTEEQIFSTLEAREWHNKHLAVAMVQLSKMNRAVDPAKLKPLLKKISPRISSFRSREVGECFAACSRFKYTDPAFLSLLCARAQEVYADFSAQEIANIYFFLTAKHYRCPPELLLRLSEVSLQKADSFSAANLANVLVGLAVFSAPNQAALVKKLCDVINARVEDLNPEQVSKVLTSLLRLKVEDPVVEKLCLLAEDNLRELQLGSATNLLDALGKAQGLNNSISDLVTQLVAEISTKEGQLSSKEISSVLAALTGLGKYNKALMLKLRAMALANAESFNSLEIANTLGALMRFGVNDPELVGKLCQVVMKHADVYNCRGISTILHILARLQVKDLALVEKLCRVARNKIEGFVPANISGTLCSLTQLNVNDPELVKGLARVALRTLNKFQARELVLTFAALTKLKYDNAEILGKIQTAATSKFREVRSDALTDALVALADANMTDAELVTRLCRALKKKIDKLSIHHIIEVLRALAKLQQTDSDLVPQLCQLGKGKAGYFHPQDIAQGLKTLTCFPRIDRAPFATRLLEEAVSKVRELEPTAMADVLASMHALGVRNERLIELLCDEVIETMSEIDLRTCLTILEGFCDLSVWKGTLYASARSQLQLEQAEDLSAAAAQIHRINARLLAHHIEPLPTSQDFGRDALPDDDIPKEEQFL